MSAALLLARLRERRVVLAREGDRLRFRSPAGAFPEALRAEVVAQRQDLLALLLREEVARLLTEADRADLLERAGIIEYDAGFPRDVATLRACRETRLPDFALACATCPATVVPRCDACAEALVAALSSTEVNAVSPEGGFP